MRKRHNFPKNRYKMLKIIYTVAEHTHNFHFSLTQQEQYSVQNRAKIA